VNNQFEKKNHNTQLATMDLQNEDLVSILTDCRKYLTEEQQRQLKLPSIVVVGAESNGKSSLLQRIIGMELLPTNARVCTRCPIEVSILNNPSVENMFKLSIVEVKGEGYETFKFENGSEFFECESVEDIRGQVTSIVSMLSNNRIQEGRTLYGTDFSEEPIKIQVESSFFEVSLSFTDLPGYNNSEVSKEKALKTIYSKVLSEDQHSIVLWVHQATCTDGSTSINREKLKQLLGETWSSRIVGVLTKVDMPDASEIAIDMMTNEDKNEITWFAVMNKGQSYDDSFQEIEENEDRVLKKVLGDHVNGDFLGISSLRQHLSTTLIEKTKALFQGNKFNQSIKRILKECNDFLANEPENASFEQKFYEIVSELRTDLKNELLSNSELARNLDAPHKKFTESLKLMDPLAESLDDLYTRFKKDIEFSGGLERGVSSSPKLLRNLTQGVRDDIIIRTDNFLDSFFDNTCKNLSNFMGNSRALNKEDKKFVALFVSKLGLRVDGSYAYQRFTKLKDQVSDLFKYSEHLLFPPESNSIFVGFEDRIIKPFNDGLDPEKPVDFFPNIANIFGRKVFKLGEKSQGEAFINVLSFVLNHLSSLIYYLISTLRCYVHGMTLEIVDKLANCYAPLKEELAAVYDKKKKAVYDDYHKKKPFVVKKKADLETLTNK